MEETLNILVFGQLTDVTNAALISVEKPTDTDHLLKILYRDYPLLERQKFLIAVDKKIINKKVIVDAAAQIALLPPFSGG